MDNYKVAIIDDSKEKLELLSNYFELAEPAFDVVELVLDNSSWTKEKIIEKLQEERIDAVIVDYQLRSTDNGINYNGDKVISELTYEFRNLPIIMISEVKDEALNSDINVFQFIERRDFIECKDVYLARIHKLITNNRKVQDEYENEVIRLLGKGNLSDDERAKLFKLDNFLEETSLYQSRLPHYYKDRRINDKLEEYITSLDSIIERLNHG